VTAMEGWKNGRMEEWGSPHRNVNRGYRKLIVWQDAIDYYAATSRVFRPFSPELRRIAANQIASVDSIHRNIAEGYCRRSIREYLQALNIALGSAGESVSGLHACLKAGQLSRAQFDELDAVAFKIENGLKRLIESLQAKQRTGEWSESFLVKESNAIYSTK